MVSATAVEFATAGVVLVATVTAGTIAHEFAHATVLRSLSVPAEVVFLPNEGEAGLLGSVSGRWATVRPIGGGERLSAWRLRAAGLAPLCLLVPFVLVPLGVAPNPLAGGRPAVAAAAVGLAGCALPSPQDFALVWYPKAALAAHRRDCDAGDS